MAEGRMLKKRISKSYKFANLKNEKARVLYLLLIPHVDVEGRYEASPTIIKGTVCPYIKSYTPRAIKQALNSLYEAGLILLYETGHEIYLQIQRFHDFNNVNPLKEAKSAIPAPTPEQLRSNSGVTPSYSSISKVKGSKVKVKESKVKEKESKVKEKNCLIIFDHWNSHSKKPWKNHQELTPETESAIRQRLEDGYTPEQLCAAIDNYASVLIDPNYIWSYAWTLYQFFTRHKPNQRDELQVWRFLPNNFRLEDFPLTARGKQSQESRQRQQATWKKFYSENEKFAKSGNLRRLASWCKKDPRAIKLIEAVRPEIKQEVEKLNRTS